MAKKNILKRSNLFSILRMVSYPGLWAAEYAACCSIQKNFFGLQRKAYKKKIHIPVVNVEHPLDKKIPFAPSFVGIYMDFSMFWVRMLAFLLDAFGKKAYRYVKDYLYEIERLYKEAAKVYSRIMSTTCRPVYKKSILFRIIYMFDPHLMCIPSLHVMIVIMTYTNFRHILSELCAADEFKDEAEKAYRHAVSITDSILLVKQHSVNCVSAGMYAIHCFSPSLFSAEEAARFTDSLLRLPPDIVAEDAAAEIRLHILNLFTLFLEERKKAPLWEDVLISFLSSRLNAPLS